MTAPIKKTKGGQKAFKPTDDQRRQVEAAGGLGLKDQDIAQIIGVAESTLKKYFSDELKEGRAKGKGKLAQTAMQMATSGKFPALTIFMCKVRLGWSEAQAHEEENQAPAITLTRSLEPLRLVKPEKEAAEE